MGEIEKINSSPLRAPLWSSVSSSGAGGESAFPGIDRTAKLYIGGKQARPDSGYSLTVRDAAGQPMGEVGDGNRKDIRNAVEAARAALKGWAGTTAHNRAQILFYLAENLAVRSEEFTARIAQMIGDPEGAKQEVELSIERLFTYAAWADKFDGAVHATPLRNVTLAMHEPLGVIGIACPLESPLLGLISTAIPAIAMGNAVVVIPSERHPLAATDLYQVLETSDLPGGVLNLVTGNQDSLIETLAAHDEVASVWYWGSQEGGARVERASAGNMKRTWVHYGVSRNWLAPSEGEGQEFLREATQVKNIWCVYGD